MQGYQSDCLSSGGSRAFWAASWARRFRRTSSESSTNASSIILQRIRSFSGGFLMKEQSVTTTRGLWGQRELPGYRF